MKNVYENIQDDFGLSLIDEKHLRYVMDVPKSMTLKRWLEIVQKITSPKEFLEYLENVICTNQLFTIKIINFFMSFPLQNLNIADFYIFFPVQKI